MFKKSLNAAISQLAHPDWEMRLQAVESLQQLVEPDPSGLLLEEVSRHFVELNTQVRRL